MIKRNKNKEILNQARRQITFEGAKKQSTTPTEFIDHNI